MLDLLLLCARFQRNVPAVPRPWRTMASSDLKRKAITENLEQAQSGSDVEAVSEPLLGNGRTKGSKNLRCKLDDARARET